MCDDLNSYPVDGVLISVPGNWKRISFKQTFLETQKCYAIFGSVPSWWAVSIRTISNSRFCAKEIKASTVQKKLALFNHFGFKFDWCYETFSDLALDWLYCAWRWLDKKKHASPLQRFNTNQSVDSKENPADTRHTWLTAFGAGHLYFFWILVDSLWCSSFFVIGRCAYLDFGCKDLASSAISQLQTIFSLAEVVLLRKFPMYEYRWLIRIGMAKKLVLVYIVDSIFCRSFKVNFVSSYIYHYFAGWFHVVWMQINRYELRSFTSPSHSSCWLS